MQALHSSMCAGFDTLNPTKSLSPTATVTCGMHQTGRHQESQLANQKSQHIDKSIKHKCHKNKFPQLPQYEGSSWIQINHKKNISSIQSLGTFGPSPVDSTLAVLAIGFFRVLSPTRCD